MTAAYTLSIIDDCLTLSVDLNNKREYLKVDFVGGPLGYRRIKGGKEAIAKAVGIKKNKEAPLVVWDVTAGLGRDAFVLAAMGCQLYMVERSPVIALLLFDGLRRAMRVPTLVSICQKMHLRVTDAVSILRKPYFAPLPQVIYLDPMFPKSRKTAVPKKEMRILQYIVGGDEDAVALLEAALTLNPERVVVKRPKGAIPLGEIVPNYSIAGGCTRYDVYLKMQI